MRLAYKYMPYVLIFLLFFLTIFRYFSRNIEPRVSSEDKVVGASACRGVFHKDIQFICLTTPVFSEGMGQRSQVDQVNIVILSRKKEDAKKTPRTLENLTNVDSALWVVPGGPGQAADVEDDSLTAWADWLVEYNIPHDLVLYSLRGTYGTNLYWRCDEYEEASIDLLSKNLDVFSEAEKLQVITNNCLIQYRQYILNTVPKNHVQDNQSKKITQGGGANSGDRALSLLATEENARDLEYLIDYLPYRDVHLWATSYGTRVALMAENKKIKTRILDSVYPFSKGSVSEWPQLLFQTFAKHQLRYSAYNAGDAYGPQKYYPGSANDDQQNSYYSLVHTLYRQLNARPQKYSLELWHSREKIPFILNGDRFLSLQLDILYDVSRLPMFYEALNKIDTEPDEMQWVLESYINDIFSPRFSSMLFFATECIDSIVEEESDIIFSLGLLQKDIAEKEFDEGMGKDIVLDQPWLKLHKIDVCRSDVFRREKSEQNILPIRTIKYSQYPTLVFSGALDPVTPTSWAQELMHSLSNALLIPAKEEGHSVLSSEACDWQSIKKFWVSLTPQAVNCDK